MTSVKEVINTQTIEYKVYQLMETSMIVGQVFLNMLDGDELYEDYVYGETDSDGYDTLIDIAIKIEKQNTDDNPLCIEDIREKAEEMILKEYGREEEN